MASGKSTVGRLVARAAGAPFLDLDEAIEAAQGLSVAEIFAAGGEPRFRAAEREAFATALVPDRVVALGGGAPLQDAIWERVRGEALSIYLEAPLEVIRARLRGGEGRPLAAGDLGGLLESRVARYREADRTVDAARPPEVVAAEVGALWSA